MASTPNAPSAEEQREEIKPILSKSLVKGDTWYLLDNKWFKNFKAFTGLSTWSTEANAEPSAENPGPIDNSSLLVQEERELREHLIEDLDFVIVHKAAWDKLVDWYGLAPNQEPIPRQVVEQGMYVKTCKVEIYPSELKLCEYSDLEKQETRKFSRLTTVAQLETEMRKIFDVTANKETRVWLRDSTNAYLPLSQKDDTLEDLGISTPHSTQVLVLEVKNEDDTWPRPTPAKAKDENSASTTYPSASNGIVQTQRYNYRSQKEASYGSVQPGLCGLSNLGNTCFMNSVLQLMSNTPAIMSYFCDDQHLSELNVDNPLGMGGEIAKAFGELVKQMWSGLHSYAMPRQFKTQVGRFAPQFSGYQQQDAQELLTFLLDGLHEDLNRIHKKPYIEAKDTDGKPDPEVAKESWTNYKKRNDSIIVDLFHGLLKSTVICPDCNRISVTFDPYCNLSLPLPGKKEKLLEVTYYSSNPEKDPLRCKVVVPKHGCFGDICEAVGRLLNVPAKELVVTDNHQNRFQRVYTQDETMTVSDRDDIGVYHVPELDNSDVACIPVYLREIVKNTQNHREDVTTGFGIPFFITVNKQSCTGKEIRNAILAKLSRFVRQPENDETWWESNITGVSMNGDVKKMDTDEEDEGTCMDENEDKAKDEPPEMYRFHFTHHYSITNQGVIENTTQAVKLPMRPTVAMTWHSAARKAFFDLKKMEEFETHESMSQRFTSRKTIQLSECLELFTTTEKLNADNAWYCSKCKKHQMATKKFDLWSLPQILVIHLKRFSYNRYYRDKLDTLVEFPINGLDMSHYVIDPEHPQAIYDLIGVCDHYGHLGGGHYTAYARNKDDGCWYHFDDSTVQQAVEGKVVSRAAYVMFYQRRGEKAHRYPESKEDGLYSEDDNMDATDS
ncbi:unnamed protein product [Darwinula stevensoni]|uniref:Ubiquitin carboxyl-terminal hydrolase n=1 Tax=Darwinula stevensoni TaxID=69355 RepID=A0A7R9FRP0_9CRUS|nr:unnamed protein product [Darwinula stevensoni]CAG0901388.1 unnamed protein product [Darwinula stevensoni]